MGNIRLDATLNFLIGYRTIIKEGVGIGVQGHL